MRTSASLTPGAIYSRKELAQQFEIKDATLFTGIFRPHGHESLWLFITERKTPDRPQYNDMLKNGDLFFEGQMSGRKDKLLAEHLEQDLEVLLFYRKSKYEFENAGFRYEGVFRFVEQSGKRPTLFHFCRI